METLPCLADSKCLTLAFFGGLVIGTFFGVWVVSLAQASGRFIENLKESGKE